MTNNSKRLLATVLTVTFAVSVAGQSEWQVVTVNEISLAGTLKDDTEFEVRIETKKPKASRKSSVAPPASVITEILVKLDGKKILFPKEAFVDLTSPLLQTVSITSQPAGELKLRFTGGEGGTYEVEYIVQPGRLAKRSLKQFEKSGDQKRDVIKTLTF